MISNPPRAPASDASESASHPTSTDRQPPLTGTSTSFSVDPAPAPTAPPPSAQSPSCSPSLLEAVPTASSSSDTLPPPSPVGPYAPAHKENAKGGSNNAGFEAGGTHDFGFLPIPRRLRWDPEHPPEFTLLLNAIFGFAATFSVANLYYVQPILIALADEFDVSYSAVINVPTLLQASYALGLVSICPLGDLVRRRHLLLLLVFCASILTLVLALVPSIRSFEAISFFLGAVSVTPQVLLPLAGDLARPEKRASALSIVLAGLLLGILFARVLSGLITEKGRIADVYFMAFGLQLSILFMLYFSLPDYPAKNKHLSYFQILFSMAKYAVAEPVLVQGCLIGGCCSLVFSCFWTTSTFLLGDVYGYNTLQIGLFGLIGIVGVCLAPLTGKLVDSLVPWTIFTACAGLSVGAIVVIVLTLDIGQQLQQVSNSSRIFSINAAARARLSAVYVLSVFIGQLIGTAAGTRVYLKHGGYRASGALCLALLMFSIFVLFCRGPHLPINRWIGWTGGWELRKGVAARKKATKEAEELEIAKSDEVEKELV